MFGSQYAMRIWVDPIKLNSYQLTIADVTSAVQAQNAQVSAGQLGSLPAPKTQELNATVSVQSRLQTAEQFGAIRLKTSRTARSFASATSPASSSGRSTTASAPIQRPSRDRGRDPPRPGRQCAEDDRRGEGADRRDRQAIPARRQGHLSVGHDAVRQGLDEAGRQDPVRSDGARLPRDVPVPAELARDADPDDRHARRAARHAWR